MNSLFVSLYLKMGFIAYLRYSGFIHLYIFCFLCEILYIILLSVSANYTWTVKVYLRDATHMTDSDLYKVGHSLTTIILSYIKNRKVIGQDSESERCQVETMIDNFHCQNPLGVLGAHRIQINRCIKLNGPCQCCS